MDPNSTSASTGKQTANSTVADPLRDGKQYDERRDIVDYLIPDFEKAVVAVEAYVLNQPRAA